MKQKTILLLLCVVFLGIAAFAGYQLVVELQEYAVGERVYNDLSQYIQIPSTVPPETIEPTAATTENDPPLENETHPPAMEVTEPLKPTRAPQEQIAWPVVDFVALQKINPDVVAWIYIPDTNINYPVVQGTDNDYYLNHLADGTWNKAGSIFIDYRNDSDFSDRNTVLYGHNMRNLSMFAQITNYVSQDYYEAHPYAMIMTPDGNYLLKFFSGYVTDVNGAAWKRDFSTDSEYSLWLDRLIEKCYFACEVLPTTSDRVVTLSTCTYEFENARFVLHGVLRPAK